MLINTMLRSTEALQVTNRVSDRPLTTFMENMCAKACLSLHRDLGKRDLKTTLRRFLGGMETQGNYMYLLTEYLSQEPKQLLLSSNTLPQSMHFHYLVAYIWSSFRGKCRTSQLPSIDENDYAGKGANAVVSHYLVNKTSLSQHLRLYTDNAAG